MRGITVAVGGREEVREIAIVTEWQWHRRKKIRESESRVFSLCLYIYKRVFE